MAPIALRFSTAVVFIVAVLVGCSGSVEDRKARHLAAGDRYFSQQKYGEALGEYQNVLQLEAGHPQALKQGAFSCEALGDQARAHSFLVRAHERDPEDPVVALKLAGVSLLGGKPEEARRLVDALLDRDPQNLEGLLLLADLVKTPQESSEALARLEALQAEPADRGRLFLALGRLRVRTGDLARALSAFKDAVSADPLSADAHMALGYFYFFSRDFARAEEEYREAAKLAPAASLPHVKLADLYLLNRKTAEARQILREFQEKDPESSPVLNRLGEIAIIDRDWQEAARFADLILGKSPSDPEGLMLRGRVALGRGEGAGALRDLQEAVRLQPSDPRGHYFLGLAHVQVEDLARARDSFKEAAGIDPGLTDAVVRIADLDLRKGLFQQALDNVRGVLNRDPANLDALVILAEAANSPPAVEEGIRAFLQAREELSDQGRFHLALGKLHLKRKDPAAAEKSFREAVLQDPGLVDAYLALADHMFLNKDFNRAERAYKAASGLVSPGSEAWMKQADFYVQVGRADEAKRILKESVEAAPGSLPALQRLARIALGEKNHEECARILDVISRKNPSDFEALVLKGQLHVARNEPNEAVKSLQEARASRSDTPQGLYLLATAYQQLGDNAQARALLREVTAKAPELHDATLRLAELDIRAGAPDLAIDPLQKFVEQYPNVGRAHRLLGLAYMMKQEFARAGKIYTKLVGMDSRDLRARYLLGLSLLMQGKSGDARKHFEEALAASPEFVEPLAQLVALDMKEKKPDKALERVQRQIRLAPGEARLQLILGRVHVAGKDLDRAEAAFLKGIEMDSGLTDAYMELSGIYSQSKKYDQALARLDAALKIQPKNVAALMLSGTIHQMRGNTTKARELYEKALAADPAFAPAANNLAYIYSEEGGDMEKALRLAQLAREKAPEDPHVADTLGWILYRKKKFEGALKPLEESAGKLPDNADVQYHLGMTLYQLGNMERAKAVLSRALELAPRLAGAEEAKRTLEEIASSAPREK